jgi:hypothetical protein
MAVAALALLLAFFGLGGGKKTSRGGSRGRKSPGLPKKKR